MTRILPTGSDATVDRGGEPSVLCIDDEETPAVLEALSSDTAYEIFRVLAQEPATPPDLAERIDSSLQNVHYHLDRLSGADVIEVTDTCYSEKGTEMDVYVVTERPMLVFLGTSDDSPSLEQAFAALASFVGPPAVLLAAAETLRQLVGSE